MKSWQKNTVQLLLILILIILVNIFTSSIFFRFDLTSEKRHTLSKTTREHLRQIKSPIYVRIYLDGDLPVGFVRLKKYVTEMLTEMNIHSNNKIKFSIINPHEIKGNKEKQNFFNDLMKQGVKPTNVQIRDKKDRYSQLLIFPSAIASYKSKSNVINFLENNPALSSEVNFNHSVENLEFNLITSFKKLITEEKKRIAFIEGHGELDEFEVADITKELSEIFHIDRVTIKGNNEILNSYDAIIIAKPVYAYPEEDKFVVDQYIMNGGKALWLIETTTAEMDSIAQKGSAFSIIRDINLNDQLFKYGVRINPTLVQDIQCAIIPVNTSMTGSSSEFVPAPWPYSPLIIASQNHPVSRNLSMIKTEFVNSMDTLVNEGVHKTILLKSSEYTRVKSVPTLIELSEVDQNLSHALFTNKPEILGVLLEGRFNSVFKNRIISGYMKNKSEFKEGSEYTKMIVLSDGDIIKNNVRQRAGGRIIEPLGYDRYSNQTFGNKNFIINSIHYLCDESGFIELRSRELKMRVLDKVKITNQRLKWQVINTLIPSLLVVILGLTVVLMRKRKFTSFL
ncbi:gliding motility-associated ABC transporter substrate-binding protein GldG [Bacteroidota bacterium]